MRYEDGVSWGHHIVVVIGHILDISVVIIHQRSIAIVVYIMLASPISPLSTFSIFAPKGLLNF